MEENTERNYQEDFKKLLFGLEDIERRCGKEAAKKFYLGMQEGLKKEIAGTMREEDREKAAYLLSTLGTLKGFDDAKEGGLVKKVGEPFFGSFLEQERKTIGGIVKILGVLGAVAGVVAFHEFFPRQYNLLSDYVSGAYESVLGK
jgi:hypothetical protein